MDPNVLTVAGGEDVVIGGGQDGGCLCVVNHDVQNEYVIWIESVCYGQEKRMRKRKNKRKRKKNPNSPQRFI